MQHRRTINHSTIQLINHSTIQLISHPGGAKIFASALARMIF
ncbi:hypothetical protein Cabys_3225 [Caldithrix abyssi DSM 13497]|uniref:Uncharacterized protein n=1 Tax=Caldithrix abyssi DSM 13497 TaxID=880073 RepID=A0A1J1CBA8_CALAY|nr:hypothetical protein Cabys_3225 [Caldithrix abyssi DSM 13497]